MPTPRSKHGSHKNVYGGGETRTNKYAAHSKAGQRERQLMVRATIPLRGRPGEMFRKGMLVRLGEWMYEIPDNVFIPESGRIDVECLPKRPAK